MLLLFKFMSHKNLTFLKILKCKLTDLKCFYNQMFSKNLNILNIYKMGIFK